MQLFGKEYEGANCHALIIMSNGGNCVSDYVAQYINSETGNKQIASITTGNTIQHILASAIAKLTVPIPSFEKQKEVAHLLCSSIIASPKRNGYCLNLKRRKKS